jgi:hypothetical protein
MGKGSFTWKKGYCRHSEAVGRFKGSYANMSCISYSASSEAFWTIALRLCGRKVGKRKLIC